MKVKADPEVESLYENAAAIHAVSSPLLIIQGQLDDVVSIEQGREVVASSTGAQKQFVEVPSLITTTCDLRNHQLRMPSSSLCVLFDKDGLNPCTKYAASSGSCSNICREKRPGPGLRQIRELVKRPGRTR